MSVKRYTVTGEQQSDIGEYVLALDYDELRAERDLMRAVVYALLKWDAAPNQDMADIAAAELAPALDAYNEGQGE